MTTTFDDQLVPAFELRRNDTIEHATRWRQIKDVSHYPLGTYVTFTDGGATLQFSPGRLFRRRVTG